jgi:predicted ATPase
MWLKTAIIKNFRGIENLSIQFDKRANVIVGPNAIGKTTLLEAIRLTKAALAPRMAEETQQVFMSLGAILPQNPTRFNYAALARDTNRAIEIDTVFSLTQSEVEIARRLNSSNSGKCGARGDGSGCPARPGGACAISLFTNGATSPSRSDATSRGCTTRHKGDFQHQS